ncbi:hypothetical protein PR048_008753 [Dryococelus australis]|uniref:Integrase catalytic domain-containing protein n=1 Tax=Dryococelus australis TaxID=614101 RepID=A0ABQ9HZ13_9NEOP|nr:hypothetical protein PR048_008753 [Dryococelus australis]
MLEVSLHHCDPICFSWYSGMIVSDNGTAFSCAAFANFADNKGIRLIKIAPYHPSFTGQAKRVVHGSDLSPCLARILLTQHVTPAAATGTSPAELLMGHRLRICLDRVHPDLAEEMKQKQEYNRVPVASLRFSPEDIVYTKNIGRGPKWVPAIIVEVSGPLSYKVIANDGVRMKRHVDQLMANAKACPPPPPPRKTV